MILGKLQLTGPTDQTTLKNGLLACWEFDETSGSTAYNATGSAPHGANAGATINQTGKLGRSWHCTDGENDYIRFGNNFNLTPASTFSISTWRQYTSTFLPGLMSKRASPYAGWSWTHGLNNEITFTFDDFNTNKTWTTTHTFSTGIWYHLLVTSDGMGNIRMYVNNVTKTMTVNGTVTNSTTNSTDLTIGGYYNSNPMRGYVDQTAIWNRQITSTERSALYNSAAGRTYANW